jgi:hypothetical protein
VQALKTFRIVAVRIALMITMLAAALAFAFGRVPALALAMGGIAGTLVFWVQAVKLEKLAQRQGARVYSVPVPWRMLEVVVYVLVLGRAWFMAPGSLRGIVPAAAGIFIIRGVVMMLGLTGFDLKQQEK